MIKRGILKAFDSGTYLATVQMIGSLPTWMHGIPVSRGIPTDQMVVGRSVLIYFSSPGGPASAVLLAVWTP
ncbi:MAG TPA: hypothetical protein VMX96_04375 [Dehalococcoidia bacterium]|nr:hypothetical protein [Dehalococcoidia bacterium]